MKKAKIEFSGLYRVKVAYTTKGFDWKKWKSYKAYEEYLNKKTRFFSFYLERSRRRAVSYKHFTMSDAIKVAQKFTKEPLIRIITIQS